MVHISDKHFFILWGKRCLGILTVGNGMIFDTSKAICFYFTPIQVTKHAISHLQQQHGLLVGIVLLFGFV
jgi:hypothetical protein